MYDNKFVIRLGSVIKKARISKNLTQEQIAEKIGLTPRYFMELENAKRTPSVRVLVNIAQVLNISVDSVIFSAKEDGQTDMRDELHRLIDTCDEKHLLIISPAINALVSALVAEM